jgi:hypothetical protein
MKGGCESGSSGNKNASPRNRLVVSAEVSSTAPQQFAGKLVAAFAGTNGRAGTKSRQAPTRS